MECPQCKTDLVMAERQGVEIDHCPKCRGVWLDRGELDKIVERSNAYFAAYARDPDSGDHDDDDDHRRYPGGGGSAGRTHPHQAAPPPPRPHYQQPLPYEQRRKKSFWEEIFD